MGKLQKPQQDALFNVILNLESLEDAYAFFEDLCTVKEVEAMTQRLEAARLLLNGYTYEQIIEKTKISSTTLSRVSSALHYGTGYKKELKK